MADVPTWQEDDWPSARPDSAERIPHTPRGAQAESRHGIGDSKAVKGARLAASLSP